MSGLRTSPHPAHLRSLPQLRHYLQPDTREAVRWVRSLVRVVLSELWNRTPDFEKLHHFVIELAHFPVLVLPGSPLRAGMEGARHCQAEAGVFARRRSEADGTGQVLA